MFWCGRLGHAVVAGLGVALRRLAEGLDAQDNVEISWVLLVRLDTDAALDLIALVDRNGVAEVEDGL